MKWGLTHSTYFALLVIIILIKAELRRSQAPQVMSSVAGWLGFFQGQDFVSHAEN